MTIQTFAALTALNDLARAGFKPCPLLAGDDEQPGWTGADGRRVEFSLWFPNDAFNEMPAEAEALPGIVPDGDVVAVRTFGDAISHLPPTPFSYPSGGTIVSLYRAGDDLSAAFGFNLPPRSFGWQGDDDALFVIERAQAVSVPAGFLPVKAADLPKLTADQLRAAYKAMGKPPLTGEGLDPLAEAQVTVASQRWAREIGKTVPLAPHDLAERLAKLEEHARAAKAADLAAFVAEIEAAEAADIAEFEAEAAQNAVEARDGGQGQDATPTVQPAPTAPAADPYAGLYDCRGLVGDIVRYITETAMTPAPLFALGAALTIVGTAAGRRYRGPTKSSCCLYVANIGESGEGKEHPLKCTDDIMTAAGLAEHIGAGDFDSGSGFVKMMKRKPLSLSAVDEFGDFWANMNNPKAKGWMGKMNRLWRMNWGKNFGTLRTSASATTDEIGIVAPHCSVLAASTPGQFWQALRGSDVESGTLNRLLVFQPESVARDARNPPDLPVPDRIVTQLKAVYGSQLVPHRNDISQLGEIKDLPFGEGAEAYWLTMFEGFKAKSKDPMVGVFFKRSAEMSLRIATIRAIGINPLDPVVTVEDMEWGAWIVGLSTKAMVRNATDFIADTDNQAQLKDVRRIIKAAGGTISRSALVKKLDGKLKAFELDGVMKLLIESGDVDEKMQAPGDKGGRPGKAYVLTATA